MHVQGKSTVLQGVQKMLRFQENVKLTEAIDGDDLHPQANIAKMRGGVALDDSDRLPWLFAVADASANALHILHEAVCIDGAPKHEKAVHVSLVACSALRTTYRDALTSRMRTRRVVRGNLAAPLAIVYVYLAVAESILEARVLKRAATSDHFMPPSLLKSQLETLELPHCADTSPKTSYTTDVVLQIRIPEFQDGAEDSPDKITERVCTMLEPWLNVQN